ncbi:hypothetical protein [Aphanothece sacrum]|uniref:DUF6788 domain-containing protein n=1 Tax=Aphanothece sacrum FPU1 TaxID=1920663 RepID=A0A401IEQ5_APHSA|nr:hypothetical protein [Aphanothece sacrum]GBF79706.1 hypothetical protein AsFPU1_1105 [Aphanothece sacrum FPU1]GBF87168.1 hypothetical protein AsFPU3_4250 [Aphanothece sacrum FPU3]
MRFSVNGKYVKPVTRKGNYEIVKENDNSYLLDMGTTKEWFPKILCKPVYWCVDCKHLDGTYCQLHDFERPYQYEHICEDLELKNISPKSTKPTSWNPAHFGDIPFESEPNGQLTIFQEVVDEPPDPDDYPCFEAYEEAWNDCEIREQQNSTKTFREQEIHTDVFREQEIREQQNSTKTFREQEIHTDVFREQEIREQPDSDRALKCSLTPSQKIVDKANSKGLKGTFDLKKIGKNYYWYIRFREQGILRSVYLGKAKPEITKQLL